MTTALELADSLALASSGSGDFDAETLELLGEAELAFEDLDAAPDRLRYGARIAKVYTSLEKEVPSAYSANLGMLLEHADREPDARMTSAWLLAAQELPAVRADLVGPAFLLAVRSAFESKAVLGSVLKLVELGAAAIFRTWPSEAARIERLLVAL